MKRLFAVAVLLLLAASAQAQTITCSASGASTKQATQYAAMLARLNAERTIAGLPTFAGFPEHCASVMLAEFTSWVELQNRLDAEKVATAAKANGEQTAVTAQCTAAGLGAGCLKVQVACFVLTGNTACN
jgi:hypothetical protein